MPLMEIPSRATSEAIVRGTKGIVKSHIPKVHSYMVPGLIRQGYKKAAPSRPEILSRNALVERDRKVMMQAAFSYSRPGRVALTRDDFPPAIAPSARGSEYQPDVRTAGQEWVDTFRDRTWETSQGLVVAESPDEYGEEYGFEGLGDIGRWMDSNDRSSASTVLSNMPGASMQEYSGLNERGFAMEGLASYEDYDKANSFSKVAIIIKDISDAALKITNHWSNPERLTMKSVASELNKMGYPAESIKGIIDTASLLLPSKIRNRLYAKGSSGGAPPPAPSTPASRPASRGKAQEAGMFGGMGWAIPIAAVGLTAIFLLKRR